MNIVKACFCELLSGFAWWRRRQGGVWFKVRRSQVDDSVVWGPIEFTVWTQTPEEDDIIIGTHIPNGISISQMRSNRSMV